MVDQATAPPAVTVWQIELAPASGQRDRVAEELIAEARDIGWTNPLEVQTARGFLLQGSLEPNQVELIA